MFVPNLFDFMVDENSDILTLKETSSLGSLFWWCDD